MKNHVFRPLYVVIGAVALLLLFRHWVVPDDFGVNGANFTYGYYRAGSTDDWRAFTVKYRGKDYCEECHLERYNENLDSMHNIIQCESCHGPAIDHPDNPELLKIDKSRALCLRCHASLSFPSGGRSDIPAIDPEEHNSDIECSECHNPHNPSLADM